MSAADARLYDRVQQDYDSNTDGYDDSRELPELYLTLIEDSEISL